jgi:hypothetical protein
MVGRPDEPVKLMNIVLERTKNRKEDECELKNEIQKPNGR